VIEATKSFLATLNEHSGALGRDEVESNLSLAAEVVAPVSATALQLVEAARKRSDWRRRSPDTIVKGRQRVQLLGYVGVEIRVGAK
jgi:hypothetical protein